MKRTTSFVFVLAGSLLIAGCATERYAYNGRARSPRADTLSQMATRDIISMSKAGVSDTLIIAMMNSSGSYFRLTTQDVIDLKNAGVGERVINAMLGSDRPGDDEAVSRGYYYPPDYWYGAYPYWYFWYPSMYWGFSAGYYRPYRLHAFAFPRYSYPVTRGFYGGWWGGRARGGGGRHR